MIDPAFVFLGAVFSLVGSGRHAWLTVQGRTRPNRVSWFLWGAVPVVGFLAQVDEGVGLPAVLTLSIGVGPLMVFVASFVNPLSVWRLTPFDLWCGSLAVVAVVVWQGLGDASTAILLAVAADAAAAVPTIRKAWRTPASEKSAVYVLSGVNGTIALLTIQDWTPATYAFPVYVVCLTTILTVLILRPINKQA
ncbi:hypothetical protein ACHAAC_03865 [Aeromicrobium sp. CF4.19]|uniref:hypothetical protein n=1 Tax=Aeromicrobium sp. CF4.19 TaxID=3373082 RepID=UPI003EE76DE6